LLLVKNPTPSIFHIQNVLGMWIRHKLVREWFTVVSKIEGYGGARYRIRILHTMRRDGTENIDWSTDGTGYNGKQI